MVEEEGRRQQRPGVEPEIIPPERDLDRSAWRQGAFTNVEGTHRIYVTRLGPFGGVLLVLLIVVLAAVILLAFLGALLIWVPIVAFIALVAALSALLQPRRW